MINVFERILLWKDNLKWFIDHYKNLIVLKWLKKCPSCYSDNLQFVETHPRRNILEKWFCRDCTAFHYSYRCQHCRNRNWIISKFKTHIYREYRLGKFRDMKKFYDKQNESYIRSDIRFHKKAVKVHEKRLKEFLKYKRRIKYG